MLSHKVREEECKCRCVRGDSARVATAPRARCQGNGVASHTRASSPPLVAIRFMSGLRWQWGREFSILVLTGTDRFYAMFVIFLLLNRRELWCFELTITHDIWDGCCQPLYVHPIYVDVVYIWWKIHWTIVHCKHWIDSDRTTHINEWQTSILGNIFSHIHDWKYPNWNINQGLYFERNTCDISIGIVDPTNIMR